MTEATTDVADIPGEQVSIPTGGASFADLVSEHVREYGGAVDVEEDLADIEVDGDTVEEDVVPEGEVTASEVPRGPGSGKRPGTDEVKSYLRENFPEALEVVSGMEANMMRNIQETKELQSQLIDTLNEVTAMRNGGQGNTPAPTEEEQPDEKIYTAEQAELIQQYLRDNGYISREDLAAEEAAKAEETYVSSSLKEGVEQYGEALGTLDNDGNVVLNPEIREMIAPIMERLETQGVTPMDLVRIANPDFLQGSGRASQPKAGPRRSPAALQRANGTVRRSSGASSTPGTKIYDRAKGDTGDDVFRRAFALSKRDITNR